MRKTIGPILCVLMQTLDSNKVILTPTSPSSSFCSSSPTLPSTSQAKYKPLIVLEGFAYILTWVLLWGHGRRALSLFIRDSRDYFSNTYVIKWALGMGCNFQVSEKLLMK